MTFLKLNNLVSKTYYGVTLCNENESLVPFSYIPLLWGEIIVNLLVVRSVFTLPTHGSKFNTLPT